MLGIASPEPERAHTEEVRKFIDLACRVSLCAQKQVIPIHACAVVGHANQVPSSVLDFNQIRLAPESMLLSINSLTTLAGRSTPPRRNLRGYLSERILIRPIAFPTFRIFATTLILFAHSTKIAL